MKLTKKSARRIRGNKSDVARTFLAWSVLLDTPYYTLVVRVILHFQVVQLIIHQVTNVSLLFRYYCIMLFFNLDFFI